MSSPTQLVSPDAIGNRLAAVILAAGYSSRMAGFKPLLPLAGLTAFERCIELFRASGITEIIAVLGHRSDELQLLAQQAGARSILNPHFDRGMFSSIITGSNALPGWVEAAFILPSDIPLVRPATVRQLAAAWAAHRAGIVYPMFDGHRGHPPLIARDILAEAAHAGASGRLSTVLANHENVAVDERVADQAIHLDMDTPADYEFLLSLPPRRNIPTAAECEALLASRQVDPRVIRHSRKVADVAHRMSAALVGSGLKLNLERVQAGALLHDVAKGLSDHAAAGASILRSMDFESVAEIVAAHTDLGDVFELDEKSIVYLADKLVRGEDLVTLTQRFRPALDRFKHNKLALHAARKRLAIAKELALAVETRLGAPLSAVLSEDSNSHVRHPHNPTAQEAANV
jgi:molybdenum cofactor cytidylyltransferase